MGLTLVGLIYYSFLNEENELNNHLGEGEMPRVTDGHHTAQQGSTESTVPEPAELSTWQSIVEKNKYFPVLEDGQPETKQDVVLPEEYFGNQKSTQLRKGKKKTRYPVGKENYFKLPKLKKGKYYPHVQSSRFSDRGQKRPERMKRVKDAFMKSWATYTDFGYGHDEVKPLSHEATDPFNGWSATLVDALDTLYLMDEKEELQKAIKFLKTVNFKQSYRDTVPVFENVIRILGGLLTAHELTKEASLLSSAKDLANFIMEAFDTPNRMPLLYYKWRSELHNRFASRKSSVAEVGTLSLEFAKLTELTGDNQYFDAITRITNALDTSSSQFLLKGLYPTYVDMSGCRLLTAKEQEQGVHLNNPKVVKTIFGHEYVYCLLTPEIKPSGANEKYSIGALGDSFYEYMPKMFHYLRGSANAEVYKNMYLSALNQVKNFMLFRPKIPGNPDVLFVSSLSVFKTSDSVKVIPQNEMQHLSCFAGGMIALGARLLNMTEDIEIAEKITMGCVHLYDQLGIMPEVLKVDAMQDESDLYDEAKRIEFIKKETEGKPETINGRPTYRDIEEEEDKETEKLALKALSDIGVPATDDSEVPVTKRELKAANGGSGDQAVSKPKKIEILAPVYTRFSPLTQSEDGSVFKWASSPNQPLWINDADPRYILRPEAIESVFYMYRITGDLKWRDYGWNMWRNVEKLCQVDGEFTEIHNMFLDLSDPKRFRDSMESFWFSETLKYYYLLFDDSSVWSLDEYVFNTEAHPLKVAG